MISWLFSSWYKIRTFERLEYINRAKHTVIVVPLSIEAKPRSPMTIQVDCLGRKAVAVCEQIRAVDKTRLLKLEGCLSLQDIDALKQVLSLD